MSRSGCDARSAERRSAGRKQSKCKSRAAIIATDSIQACGSSDFALRSQYPAFSAASMPASSLPFSSSAIVRRGCARGEAPQQSELTREEICIGPWKDSFCEITATSPRPNAQIILDVGSVDDGLIEVRNRRQTLFSHNSPQRLPHNVRLQRRSNPAELGVATLADYLLHIST